MTREEGDGVVAPGKKWKVAGALQREPLGTGPEPPPDWVGGSEAGLPWRVRAVMVVGAVRVSGVVHGRAEGEKSGDSVSGLPAARVAWKRKSELLRP
jgi:hypothetical protein